MPWKASSVMEERLPAAPRQPVRPEVVTHVSGTICHPCLRVGQGIAGAPEGIRTPDPQIRSLVLYPAELPAPRVP
jgi:hypothetical protein